jgi:hypothetical protein
LVFVFDDDTILLLLFMLELLLILIALLICVGFVAGAVDGRITLGGNAAEDMGNVLLILLLFIIIIEFIIYNEKFGIIFIKQKHFLEGEVNNRETVKYVKMMIVDFSN